MAKTLSRREQQRRIKLNEEAMAAFEAGKRRSKPYHDAEAVNVSELLQQACGRDISGGMIYDGAAGEDIAASMFLYVEPNIKEGTFNLWRCTIPGGGTAYDQHMVRAAAERLSGAEVDTLFKLWDEKAAALGLTEATGETVAQRLEEMAAKKAAAPAAEKPPQP